MKAATRAKRIRFVWIIEPCHAVYKRKFAMEIWFDQFLKIMKGKDVSSQTHFTFKEQLCEE